MTQPKVKKLPHSEFIQAGRNWGALHGITNKRFKDWPSWDASLVNFLEFNPLHSEWYSEVTGSNIHDYKNVAVPAAAFDKLKMLASPHFRTLLKAY